MRVILSFNRMLSAVLSMLSEVWRWAKASLSTTGRLSRSAANWTWHWLRSRKAWENIVTFLGFVGSIVGILAFIFIFWQPWYDTQVARGSVDVDRTHVRAENRRGDALWTTRVFQGTVLKAPVALDIDNDGGNELVIAITGDDEDTGSLFIYDRAGTLRTQIETFKLFLEHHPSVYSPESLLGAHRARFTIRDFQVVDLLDSPGKEMVVSVHDVTWYLSAIMIFGSDGKLIGDFIHPGHIQQFKIGQFGNNWKIAVVAINNDLTRRVPDGTGYAFGFFLLDPRRLSGEAPPHTITDQPGSQDWYMLVAPKGNGYAPTEIQIGKKNSNDTNDLTIKLECGLYLTFNDGTDKLGLVEKADNYTCPREVRVRQLNHDATEIIQTFSGF